MNLTKANALIAAVAAATIFAGVAEASAAGFWHSSSSSTMGRQASDTLNLTSAQRKMAWADLSAESSKQNIPPGFKANVGAVVPSTFKIEPVPGKAAENIPSLKAYDFAMTPGKLFIVNPSDKKIVDVITG